MADFLLEIGCEEIPARMIEGASQELGRRVGELLSRERLTASANVVRFSTPRRLSLIASGLAAVQPDVEEQVMGPSTKVAYKDGVPAAPALAFAKKVGIPLADLQRISTPKGEYLAATVKKKGRAASDILCEMLPRELGGIYWPKNMYWRKPSERFVRPVRWLVAMLDGEVVPLEFDGVAAGNASQGHRILSPGPVQVSRAAAYVESLRRAKVLSSEERLQQIRKALDAAARNIAGARWREDRELLDTVVHLTEFPSALLGNFDPEYLELPEEVLVTVMRDHQKYFALEDASGKLLPHFLAVLNTDGDPDGTIRHGHERVLRARFNDARFFWQTDQKHPLRERMEWLRHVTFQKDLGSYYDKAQRVQRLCSWISEIVRRNGMQVRPGVVHKAACLAKTDLTTELVKEFTELQGIVGGLYARVQQLDPDLPVATRISIADAIYDQYKPESMEDTLPRTIEGAVLSIGDKADSIAGMFGLGLVPSGSKDPFALRRQANAIVRIIAEYKLPLRLDELFGDALAAYQHSAAAQKMKSQSDIWLDLNILIFERLTFYLREFKGYSYDVVSAVLSSDHFDILGTIARADAVKQVKDMPDFQAIAAASKRMRNILRQAAEKGIKPAESFQYFADAQLEEKMLAAQVEKMAPRVESSRNQKDYLEALLLLSTVRPTLDTFFDKVMVMVDDEGVRANRLALLASLLREFSTIADFSEIVTEGKS
ncbi:MAG TPA: glycine--tRNA ligase subunit beta [Terriglobales bacterium]|nr:glycine--tRNA ligase subunit beta [Terriglobales bacterium]